MQRLISSSRFSLSTSDAGALSALAAERASPVSELRRYGAQALIDSCPDAGRLGRIQPFAQAPRLRLQRLAATCDAADQLLHRVIPAHRIRSLGVLKYFVIQQGEIVIVAEVFRQALGSFQALRKSLRTQGQNDFQLIRKILGLL